jgi:L-threonylcarbamoyladenylate synthase
VVAYPTEAVFGLGCDPLNRVAVERLLALKGRPAAKGLILIAAGLDQLEPFLDQVPAAAMARVLATWPGPRTWLLPGRADVPAWVRGEHRSVAVRVTAHPLAAALCRAAGMALVSTSANRAGRRPCRTALAVRRAFGGELDYLLPGAVGGQARPTAIRDALSGAVLRVG